MSLDLILYPRIYQMQDAFVRRVRPCYANIVCDRFNHLYTSTPPELGTNLYYIHKRKLARNSQLLRSIISYEGHAYEQ